ncbi:MAG TPA: hypothetical protein PK093_01905 [Phycisphaerae bacterium]|nr:hypothetical protein [Phycisphaerae bacterium]
MASQTEQPSSLADAVDCIRQMRSTLAAVITGIPDFRFKRPNDLSTKLGLDPKLAWNIGRCIEETDPFAAAQFLPGPKGVKKLLEAAIRHHTPVDLANAARVASDRFNEIVRHQAGTRRNFNILMAGNSKTVRPSADIEHRRRAFEGASYIFGVHAQTIFRSCLAMPSDDPERWDFATLRGIVDFCRLRPNVAWRITRPVSVDADRTYHHDVPREAIDANATTDENALPLMLDYCTHPVPKFRTVRGAYGHIEYEFVSDSVGIDSRITCITGEMLRRFEPRYRNDVYDDFCLSFPIRTPAACLVFDVIVHRDLFAPTAPLRGELYNDLFAGGPGFYYEASDRLPLHESVEYLGAGPDVAVTPDIPGYYEMLQMTLDRCDCRREDYDIHRIRIEYPPIATRLLIRRPYPLRGE